MKTIAVLTLSLIAGVSLLSAEVLTDVGFPPPGGVTWTPSGCGAGCGENFAYTGFNINPALYSAYYWGPVSVANVRNSNQASTGQMTYAGINGTSYEFDSTALWEGTYNTRMLLTPHGLGPEGTESSLGASTTPSYPLFLVTPSYNVDFVFQALVGSNWIAVDTVYSNQFGNDPNVHDTASVSFDFFTAPAETPEPGSFLLLGSGALLMGLYRRRARR